MGSRIPERDATWKSWKSEKGHFSPHIYMLMYQRKTNKFVLILYVFTTCTAPISTWYVYTVFSILHAYMIHVVYICICTCSRNESFEGYSLKK